MGELSYAASIASRGKSKPEQRSALSDELFSAADALEAALSDLREHLAIHLEGHEDACASGEAETRFMEAGAQFEAARAAATRFLLDEGDIVVTPEAVSG